jgi:hypothetical protein
LCAERWRRFNPNTVHLTAIPIPFVIPAQAGIKGRHLKRRLLHQRPWIPACAGMTKREGLK